MIHCSGQHVLSSSSCCSNWSLFVLFVLIDRSEGRKVVLGAHSLSEPEDSKQTFNIVEVFSHPDFCTSNYDNDIALVKVSHIPVFSLSVSVSLWLSPLCQSPFTVRSIQPKSNSLWFEDQLMVLPPFWHPITVIVHYFWPLWLLFLVRSSALCRK